jgi:hypothetical protein
VRRERPGLLARNSGSIVYAGFNYAEQIFPVVADFCFATANRMPSRLERYLERCLARGLAACVARWDRASAGNDEGPAGVGFAQLAEPEPNKYAEIAPRNSRESTAIYVTLDENNSSMICDILKS